MIIKGKLSICVLDCLNCNDMYLLDIIGEDFNKGDNVFVKYYITDKEVSEDEALDGLMLKTCGGNIDELDFVLDAYSEWTILEYNEELIIGGHDMFRELQEYAQDEKYMLMIIEKIQ